MKLSWASKILSQMYGSVMIDLETLSTRTNASIIAIAAVEFDNVSGETGESIELFIDSSEWGRNDRHIDGETVKWWMQQSDDARRHIFNSKGCSLHTALRLLSEFIERCDAHASNDVVVWGNGATMDITILQSAYEYFDIPLPWKYWAVNDVRTIVDLYPSIKEETKKRFKGVQHTPLDDCRNQIKYLTETIRYIHNIYSEDETTGD